MAPNWRKKKLVSKCLKLPKSSRNAKKIVKKLVALSKVPLIYNRRTFNRRTVEVQADYVSQLLI